VNDDANKNKSPDTGVVKREGSNQWTSRDYTETVNGTTYPRDVVTISTDHIAAYGSEVMPDLRVWELTDGAEVPAAARMLVYLNRPTDVVKEVTFRWPIPGSDEEKATRVVSISKDGSKSKVELQKTRDGKTIRCEYWLDPAFDYLLSDVIFSNGGTRLTEKHFELTRDKASGVSYARTMTFLFYNATGQVDRKQVTEMKDFVFNARHDQSIFTLRGLPHWEGKPALLTPAGETKPVTRYYAEGELLDDNTFHSVYGNRVSPAAHRRQVGDTRTPTSRRSIEYSTTAPSTSLQPAAASSSASIAGAPSTSSSTLNSYVVAGVCLGAVTLAFVIRMALKSRTT